MSRPRDKRPAQQASGNVTVPDVIRMGCLIEAWSATGDRLDAGSAWSAHLRARLAWCRAQHLDTPADMALKLPSGAPWSASDPGGVERLASLGHAPSDLHRLRTEAQRHVTATSPRRTK